MKVLFPQEALLSSLKIVSRAVSGQNTLPVLGNILIQATDGEVRFSATNLEISISTSIKAEVTEEGSITVPAKILTSYASLLSKKEDVELEALEGNTLKVKSKSSTTKIKGIGAGEFPQIAEVEGGKNLALPSRDFRSIVGEVAFASQENASRPIFSGVLFVAKDKQLTVAATDSFRLSEKKIDLFEATEGVQCLIPVRAIFEADKLANLDENVVITVSDNQVKFSAGQTQLISRLIEGQFPDYTQIIPKESSTEVIVPRDELALAVRRVSIFAKENNQHMRWEFPDNNTMVIRTDSTQIGEEKTTVNVNLKGELAQIALNADYVLDILSALDEKNVRIELEGKMTPAILKKEKSDHFIHLVMPLKM